MVNSGELGIIYTSKVFYISFHEEGVAYEQARERGRVWSCLS